MKRLLVIPVVLVAGCLPSRDNPRDPSLAPSARLRVTDTTLPDGGCSTSVVVSSNDVVVLSASRGIACLALDARQTTDPQGDPMTFEYSLVDADGGELETIPGSGPLVLLSDTFRRSHEPGVPLRFRVRASDSGGASREAETLLTLENARPTAVAPLPRTLPRGGFTWSLGVPFRIEFDGSQSTDPDGDTDLQFCWTFPAELPPADATCPSTGTLCRPDPHDACFTRSLAADAELSRTTATLEVLDSANPAFASKSLSTRATVALRSRPIYAAPGIDFGNYQRMDSIRETFLAAGMFDDSSTVAYLPQQDRVLVATAPVSELMVFTWPGLEAQSAHPFVADDLILSPQPDGGGVWSSFTSTNGEPQLVHWTLANDVLTPSPPIPSVATGAAFFDQPRLAVDGANRAWVSSTQADSVVIASTDGSSIEHTFTGDRVLVGVAPRPASEEVWILQSADWIGGTSYESTRILRYDGPDASPEVADVGPLAAAAFEWADEDRLWMLVADRGLLLVDADLFFATRDVDLATLQQIDVAFFFFTRPFIDPSTGDAWFSDVVGNELVHARPDGSIIRQSYLPLEPPPILFIDEDGAVVTVGENTITRGLGLAPDGSIQTLPVIGRFNATIDHDTGGLWVPVFFPSALLHVAEDGAVLSFENSITFDGSQDLFTFPPIEVFRMHAGSSVAWLMPLDFATFQPSGLFLTDVKQRPPDARTVMTAAEILDNLPLQNGTNDILFEASAEIPGMERFAWIGLRGPGSAGSGIPGQIFTMTSAGLASLVHKFDLPANEIVDTMFGTELVLHGALSPASNSICFATFESDEVTTSIVRLRRLFPDGSVELLDSISLPPGQSQVEGVATSADAEGEVCWVAYQDRSDVDPQNWSMRFVGYSAPGAEWRTFSTSMGAGLQSFIAPTNTRIFASFLGGGSAAERVILEDLTGSNVTEIRLPGERARFLGPDAGGR